MGLVQGAPRETQALDIISGRHTACGRAWQSPQGLPWTLACPHPAQRPLGAMAAHAATLKDEQFGHGLPEHGEAALRAEAEAGGGDFKLQPHPTIPRSDKPLLLIVLDGLGVSK